jgi:hypothetical protein
MKVLDEGRALIAQLEAKKALLPQSDWVAIEWGISQIKAKMASDERMMISEVQKRLSKISDFGSFSQSLIHSQSDDELAGALLEMIYDILKEAYKWQASEVITNFIPIFKSNLLRFLKQHNRQNTANPLMQYFHREVLDLVQRSRDAQEQDVAQYFELAASVLQ